MTAEARSHGYPSWSCTANLAAVPPQAIRERSQAPNTAPRAMKEDMGKLSPIESEFDSTEDAEAYDRWFRAKVEASMADARPGVPHATVMAELDDIIDQAERRSRAR